MNDTTSVISDVASHVMSFVRAEKTKQFLHSQYQSALKANKIKELISASKPPIQQFFEVLQPTNQSSTPAIQINLSETEADQRVWIVPTVTKSHKSTKSGLVDRLAQALVNPALAENVAHNLSERSVAIAVCVLAATVERILQTMTDLNEREMAQQIVNAIDAPLTPKVPSTNIKLVNKLPTNLDTSRVYYLRPDSAS